MKLARRNLLAILPAAVLSIFGVGAQAATGPTLKPTKLGQKIVFQGYTYITVKSKGKLVWKKGAKVKASSPSKKPSASPTQSASTGELTFAAKSGDINEGQAKIVVVSPAGKPNFPISLTRLNGTVIAVSAICTHSGCVVDFASGQLLCPCHGSAFNAVTGAVNQGPAQSALRKFTTKEDAGSIFILV